MPAGSQDGVEVSEELAEAAKQYLETLPFFKENPIQPENIGTLYQRFYHSKHPGNYPGNIDMGVENGETLDTETFDKYRRAMLIYKAFHRGQRIDSHHISQFKHNVGVDKAEQSNETASPQSDSQSDNFGMMPEELKGYAQYVLDICFAACQDIRAFRKHEGRSVDIEQIIDAFLGDDEETKAKFHRVLSVPIDEQNNTLLHKFFNDPRGMSREFGLSGVARYGSIRNLLIKRAYLAGVDFTQKNNEGVSIADCLSKHKVPTNMRSYVPMNYYTALATNLNVADGLRKLRHSMEEVFSTYSGSNNAMLKIRHDISQLAISEMGVKEEAQQNLEEDFGVVDFDDDLSELSSFETEEEEARQDKTLALQEPTQADSALMSSKEKDYKFEHKRLEDSTQANAKWLLSALKIIKKGGVSNSSFWGRGDSPADKQLRKFVSSVKQEGKQLEAQLKVLASYDHIVGLDFNIDRHTDFDLPKDKETRQAIDLSEVRQGLDKFKQATIETHFPELGLACETQLSLEGDQTRLALP